MWFDNNLLVDNDLFQKYASRGDTANNYTY